MGDASGTQQVGGIDGVQLQSVVERIERMEEEIKARNADKADIYQEAKGNGYDVKIIKKIVAIRRKDPAAVDEEETLLDLYKNALGMR